ncbi:MAG: tRNA dihydrouridine synthase DusB, partial [bacterium]
VRRHIRQGLANVSSLAEVDDLLSLIDADQEADVTVMSAPRGRTGGERAPSLPDGWLDSPYLGAADAASVREAEFSVSGG